MYTCHSTVLYNLNIHCPSHQNKRCLDKPLQYYIRAWLIHKYYDHSIWSKCKEAFESRQERFSGKTLYQTEETPTEIQKVAYRKANKHGRQKACQWIMSQNRKKAEINWGIVCKQLSGCGGWNMNGSCCGGRPRAVLLLRRGGWTLRERSKESTVVRLSHLTWTSSQDACNQSKDEI